MGISPISSPSSEGMEAPDAAVMPFTRVDEDSYQTEDAETSDAKRPPKANATSDWAAFHGTESINLVGYNDASMNLDTREVSAVAMKNKNEKREDNHDAAMNLDYREDSTATAKNVNVRPATNTTSQDEDATAEFDDIARDMVLLLDKKVNTCKTNVKTVLNESNKYFKTLAECYSMYTRTQRMEYQESQRLDIIEPDVHGATNHLLTGENRGNMVVAYHQLDSDAMVGSKRKPGHE